VRSRVLFRSDRGHYRRREAPDPQRLQRGRGFVHVKARQAFPEIGRQVRRREQTAVRASRWRRRSCRALPDAPAPPKLRDRVRGWDLEFESGLLQRRVVRTSVQTSKPRAGRCVRPHRHPHCRPRHRCRRGVARHQFRSAKRNIGNPGHSGCPEPEAASAATPLCCNSSLISRAVSSRSA
jgi:hypothetical protein